MILLVWVKTMLVKICGVQSQATARVVADAGADLIGFVFAKSKRQLKIEAAQAICEGLPSSVKSVGVFVNKPIEEVNQIADQVGLDYVQLHGNESLSACRASRYPVIKSISIQTFSDVDSICHYINDVDYVLLDGAVAGSGHVFDWNLIDSFKLKREKLILAGGLTLTNVQQAIHHIQPAGVDVSSGVEVNGVKDDEKIIQFIKNAKEG